MMGGGRGRPVRELCGSRLAAFASSVLGCSCAWRKHFHVIIFVRAALAYRPFSRCLSLNLVSFTWTKEGTTDVEIVDYH